MTSKLRTNETRFVVSRDIVSRRTGGVVINSLLEQFLNNKISITLRECLVVANCGSNDPALSFNTDCCSELRVLARSRMMAIGLQ